MSSPTGPPLTTLQPGGGTNLSPPRLARAKIRIAIVDDHGLVREGLTLVLSNDPEFEVVGAAADGGEGFALLEETRPDVALVDITLPDTDGIPLVRAFRARFPDVGVIVLTMHQDAETVRQALMAGAAGYVAKGATSHELGDAIRAVRGGHRYLHSAIASYVVEDSIRWLRSGAPVSPREREILSLLATGQRAAAIARTLGISTHTVRRHIANLTAKLEVHGVSGLIRYAVSNQLARESE